MYKFIDEKKKKTISLNNSFLITNYSTLASGATLSIVEPNVNWSEIKNIIGMRDINTNNPLGIVITKPNADSFFVETVWEDLKDSGQADGDIALFEKTAKDTFSFSRKKPDEIKKEYPAWDPYHHEDKSFLKK